MVQEKAHKAGSQDSFVSDRGASMQCFPLWLLLCQTLHESEVIDHRVKMVACGSAPKPRENKMSSDVAVCSERCACSGGGTFSSGGWPSSRDPNWALLVVSVELPTRPICDNLEWKQFTEVWGLQRFVKNTFGVACELCRCRIRQDFLCWLCGHIHSPGYWGPLLCA